MKTCAAVFLPLAALSTDVTQLYLVRNEKVAVFEEIVRPAETESAGDGLASITIFLNEGSIRLAPDEGKPVTRSVKRGDVIFRTPHDGKISDQGAGEIRLLRIEFRARESAEVWGTTGLAPDYKVLVENGYARVYNIRIPAGSSEPRHTHYDRVVVCLSGARLRHLMPDGHEEDSTLVTGQCVWRLGQTHVGKNIGSTDFWAIAIEPK
jgi:hypothetical protein